MKLFIKNTVLFSIFSLVYYIIFIFIFGCYAPSKIKPNLTYPIGNYGHMHTRLSEVKKATNIDILFLGSSHAYRGFDTRIFSKMGFSTFNLGSSSQTPIQTKVLLNRYIKILNPKLVIYEVFPETFSIDGVESALDLIANDKNDLFSLKMALKINNIKIYNTILYGLIRDFLNLNENFKEKIIKDDDTYIFGGYVERKIDYFKPIVFKSKEIIIRKNQLESFSEIISFLKKNNYNVILVYAPIPKIYYNSFSNNGYFDSIMMSFSKYYNYNNILNMSDSIYFYDSHHLNQNGVELFNYKIIEILNKEKYYNNLFKKHPNN